MYYHLNPIWGSTSIILPTRKTVHCYYSPKSGGIQNLGINIWQPLLIRALRRRPRRISACCTTPRAGPPPIRAQAPVQRKRRVGHRTMNNWDVTNKNGGMICMMRIESRYNGDVMGTFRCFLSFSSGQLCTGNEEVWYIADPF